MYSVDVKDGSFTVLVPLRQAIAIYTGSKLWPLPVPGLSANSLDEMARCTYIHSTSHGPRHLLFIDGDQPFHCNRTKT